MASSHPSGVVRSQEMRDRFPLSSLAWHPPHLLSTSGSVTGMPGSGVELSSAGACAQIGRTAGTARSTHARNGLIIIILSLETHLCSELHPHPFGRGCSADLQMQPDDPLIQRLVLIRIHA